MGSLSRSSDCAVVMSTFVANFGEDLWSLGDGASRTLLNCCHAQCLIETKDGWEMCEERKRTGASDANLEGVE